MLLLVLLAVRWWLNRHPQRWVAALGAAWVPGQLPLLQPQPEQVRGRRAWPWLGFALLAVVLTAIELREPLFFTQDDNRSGALPNMVPGFRAMWSGELPQYNPYLGLGAPMMNRGMDSYTYPPSHLAYGIARFVLRNEVDMFEVWALLHLAAGYWAAYALLRYLGMRPWVAMSGSLAFVLSGAVLIIGRSWQHFIPPVVWQPLMMLMFVRFVRGEVGVKWAAISALIVGMFYHVGFPQAVILTLMPLAFMLGLLLCLKVVPWKRLWWLVPAGLFAAGLCLPLFIPQWRIGSDLPMDVYGTGIRAGLLNMVVPTPLHNGAVPDFFIRNHPQAGQFYYFGSVFAVLALLAVVATVIAKVPRRGWVHACWAVGLLVMLDFNLGHNGLLYPAVLRLGHANLWHYPWRALSCLVLLAVICGGLMLEGLLREALLPRFVAWSAGVLANLMIVYHALLPLPSFMDYGFRPFPPMPDDLRALLLTPDSKPNGRVWPEHPTRSTDPNFVMGMGLNYPTYYGVASVKVYDPLHERSPMYRGAMATLKSNFMEGLNAYGVRWVVISTVAGVPGITDKAVPRELLDLPVRLTLPGVVVREVSNPDPFAFLVADEAKRPLNTTFSHSGVRVDLPPMTKPQDVIVNVLSIEDLTAYVDGVYVDASEDGWGRVKVQVPAGAKVLELRYQPPWARGLAIGGVALLAGAYVAWRLAGETSRGRRSLR